MSHACAPPRRPATCARTSIRAIALELLIAPLTHRWLLRTLPLTHAYADAVVDHALRGLVRQGLRGPPVP